MIDTTISDKGESMDIPMNKENRADHNADRFAQEQMINGKNPVGNEKDCN